MSPRPPRAPSRTFGDPSAAREATGFPRDRALASLPDDWAARTYLALDFETTGLDPGRDRVVEIGAVKFGLDAEGAPVELGVLGALVDPGIPISPAARAVNGIRDEELVGAPRFGELASSLLALAEGSTIVAHNAPFDLSFLRAELAVAGMPDRRGDALDTRLLARAAFPGRPGYRLGDLAAAFGLRTGAAHRALDDARTCMALFVTCARRLAGTSAE